MHNSKSLIYILLTLAATIVLTAIIFSADKGTRYDGSVVSDEDYQMLIIGRQSCDDLRLTIMFNDEELLYDSASNTYMYSVNLADSNSVNPVVQAESDLGEMDIAFLESTITTECVSNDKGIKFIAYNNSSYIESTLKCTTLPVISISTDQVIPETRDSVDMKFTLYDNSARKGGNTIESDGTIRVRGKMAMENPKKSYKFSLSYGEGDNAYKNKVSLLGMEKDDDWILSSMFEDYERVRDVFCTNLYKQSMAGNNSLSVDLGGEYRYTELFINGEYQGLYALGYKPRDKKLGINDNSLNRVLFFKTDVIRNGPIYIDRTGTPYLYSIRSGHASDAFSVLTNCMIAANEKGQDLESLCSVVDIDNIIDFYLYINLIQGMDNLDNNQYILVDQKNGNYKLLYGLWDMNYVFGLDYDKEYVYSPDEMFLYDYGIVANLINLDPDSFKDKLSKRYWELRSDAWSDEAIDRMMDECEADIIASGAYSRECRRWADIQGLKKGEGLSRFKNYVHDRFAAMDLYASDPEVTPCEADYLTFGVLEVYEAAEMIGADYAEGETKILQVKNKELMKDSFYEQFLTSLSIPNNRIYGNVSLKAQLYEYTGNDYFYSMPEDTDLIILSSDGQAISSSGFFEGGVTVHIPEGDITYEIDESSRQGILLLDGAEIARSNLDDDYWMMKVNVDNENKSVSSIKYW